MNTEMKVTNDGSTTVSSTSFPNMGLNVEYHRNFHKETHRMVNTPPSFRDEDLIINQTHTPDKALRYNEGKLKWNLIHYDSLKPMVRALEYGALKYAPFNWQKPMDKREILNSLMRHLVALMDGEEVDVESGVEHIGCILANSMFYSYHSKK